MDADNDYGNLARPGRSAAQIKSDALDIARKRHPDGDLLQKPYAVWIWAEHLQSAGIVSEALATERMQEYFNAKYGRGYNPRLPVRWPQATTDGRIAS